MSGFKLILCERKNGPSHLNINSLEGFKMNSNTLYYCLRYYSYVQYASCAETALSDERQNIIERIHLQIHSLRSDEPVFFSVIFPLYKKWLSDNFFRPYRLEEICNFKQLHEIEIDFAKKYPSPKKCCFLFITFISFVEEYFSHDTSSYWNDYYGSLTDIGKVAVRVYIGSLSLMYEAFHYNTSIDKMQCCKEKYESGKWYGI